MKVGRRDILIGVVSAAIGAIAVMAAIGLGHCGSYQECLVRNMRGQDSAMLEIVSQLCRERHPSEAPAPKP
jgi:hypothetical protein